MELRSRRKSRVRERASIGPIESVGEDFEREVAAEKISVIDRAMDRTSTIRAELGSKQSRLTSTINNLAIAKESLSASRSRIRDVDFAAETANYTQFRILQQGGVSVLSQANGLPELALQLLR